MDELVNNPVFFGIVVFEFAWDFIEYLYYKKTLNAVKKARVFNPQVAKTLRSGGRIPYCLVEGKAKAVNQPIASDMQPGVTGVIRRLKVMRLIVSRDFFGTLQQHTYTVRDVFEKKNFGVVTGKTFVAFTEKFVANLRDVHLEGTGYDIRQASESASHVQQAFEFTERMLKEGTLMIALGEVTFDGKNFVVSVPRDGTQHYLTTGPLSAIEENLDSFRKTSRFLALIFGGIAALLVGCYVYQMWKNYQQTQQVACAPLPMSEPDEELPYELRCVVCRYYARTVVLLPCRHFSLCAACLGPVNDRCPVCRRPIKSTVSVYVA